MNKHADFEEHFYLETLLTPTLLIIWLLQLDTHTLGLGPSPSLGLYLLSSFWEVALVYPYFWGSDPIDYEAANPNAMASVDRLWPIPATYQDSWAALRWVVSHCNNHGHESWLNEHAGYRSFSI